MPILKSHKLLHTQIDHYRKRRPMFSVPDSPPPSGSLTALYPLDDEEFSASPLSQLEAAPLPYSKVINDPVHGHIELDEYCMQVVDTVQFQRLRDLKQLGSAYFVFPGASHNRFEHSIGVCYMAGVMVSHFQKTQPELNITDNDIKCVKLAGLCHDLGHGPFSHIFDNEFMKEARPDTEWTHEMASEDMLEYLVMDNEHVQIDRDEIRFIKDLIHGRPRTLYPQAKKLFLYEIVANKRNSVDVDKFDYIQRDCLNVGIKTSLDASRLIAFSRVVDNQICLNQKEMFHTRFSLFKRIYTHRVGKAIEYMIRDALLAADAALRISDSVNDMPRYVHITDSIFKEIERSTDPQLAQSRAIIERIRRRELYRFVDEILVPPSLHQELLPSITVPAILACQSPTDHLEPNDVIIEWLKLGYAMKDRNPVDLIKFFSKWQPNVSFHISKDHVSSLIPHSFEEVTCRIFTRDNDKRQKIQTAFRKLLSRVNHETHYQNGLNGASPLTRHLSNGSDASSSGGIMLTGSSTNNPDEMTDPTYTPQQHQISPARLLIRPPEHTTLPFNYSSITKSPARHQRPSIASESGSAPATPKRAAPRNGDSAFVTPKRPCRG
ncbi:hypothetical protein DFS34DRAFT_624448 [Phlyctochytrium arcticum]|nr:hypothetical protein DFS34DRAFT_624448 [Phlyctochytrium arcticum]